MKDIFDASIFCKECKEEMKRIEIEREGIVVRAVECLKCGEKIMHPSDIEAYQHFKNLKGKTFAVKLRVIGNSHAISIPKEIVEFINEQHKVMKRHMDMVELCFEDFETLKLRFGA